MSIAGGPDIVEDGLVLSLDAANSKSYPGTGANWYDLSGFDNHVTLAGGYSWESANQGAVVLDGVDGVGTCPDNSTLDMPDAWAICAWVYRTGPADSGNASKILSKWENYFMSTAGTADNFLYGCVGTGSGHTCNASDRDVTLPLNQWSNLVFTYSESSGIANLYLNNVIVHTITTATVTGPSNYDFTIGAPGAGITNQYFNGKFGTVNVYNKELTAKEILQNYYARAGRYSV